MKERIKDLQKVINLKEGEKDQGMQWILVQLQEMMRGLEFHGLRPKDSLLMYDIITLTIYSDMFMEIIEETLKRLKWDKEQNEVVVELKLIEKFWI